MPARFQVTAGRLTRDGVPVVVHGVVYHPSRSGTAMWREYRHGELATDFAAIAAAGFNTVRLYLYWRDAQPSEHEISSLVLGRLRDCVDEAATHGLACLVSLLTIFMNGELLDLPWRAGRDIWRDPDMLAAQERYVSAVAAALAPCSNLLGFDLGDEISAVAPELAATLPASDLASWYRRLRGAIGRHAPGVLVGQANNATAVFGANAFNVANAGSLDLNLVHGFPTWAAGAIESSSSVKATNLAPFLAAVAGAYRPALIDELACYGASEDIAAAYIGAAAVSCVANGALGFIVWCWQDLAYAGEPFTARPLERFMGLLRTDAAAKPAMAAAAAAVRATRGLTRRGGAQAALYLPERLIHSGSSYLDAGGGAVATFYAYLLLKRAHLHFDVVAGELGPHRLVICPGPAHLTATDLARLTGAARAGATVYLSLGDPLHGFAGPDLTGATGDDFSLLTSGRDGFAWEGEDWPIAWTGDLLPALTISAPPDRVLARFPDQSPALVRHRIGPGQVIFCAAPFERQLDQPGRLEERPWHRLYSRLAALAGARPAVWCDQPDIELVPLEAGDDQGRPVLVINHKRAPVAAALCWRDPDIREDVRVDGKNWLIAGAKGRW